MSPSANLGYRPRRAAGDVAFFAALFPAALLLGPALAHALELRPKMTLTREQYLTVQQLYAGWSVSAVVIVVEFLGVVAACTIYWRDARLRPFLLSALGTLVAGQVIFWAFTFPMNQITANWTVLPPDWQFARRQWEYSHLAGAICQVTAVVMLIVALLRRYDGRDASRA